MRVGIDLDGVCLNFQDHWKELYELWFDRDVDEKHFGTWDGIVTATHFETGSEFYRWFERAGGWDTMPPLPGALGAVDALVDEYPVIFVTSRISAAAAVAGRRWIDQHWGDRVGYRPRAGVKTHIPTTVNVDDNPAIARAFEDAGRQLILMDQSWNQDIAESQFIHRAFGWHHAVELIEEVLHG